MSDITVKFGADISEVKKAAAKMSKTVGGAASTFAGPLAGLASAGAFAALSKQVVDFADALDDNAKKLGVTTEAYQQLDFMSRVAGTDMGSVGVAIKTLANDLTDAADGNQEAADKFGILGLAVGDLKGLSPDKLFETVAKKISLIEDPLERVARASDVFGKKAGQQLMGVIEDFDALKKQASETASILDSETIAAAAKFNDTMTALFTNIAAGIGQSGLVKWLADAAAGFNNLIKSIPKIQDEVSTGMAANGGFWASFAGGVADLADKAGLITRGENSENMGGISKGELAALRKKHDEAAAQGMTVPELESKRKAEDEAAKAAKEADIKRETAARKIREAQDKIEEAGRKEISNMEKKIQLDAMRAAGMEKQASLLEKELALREKLNRPLTQDEYSNLQNLASAEQAVADYKDAQKNMNFGQPERENAVGLERIGAVYRGSFDSGRDRILNMQLDQLKKLHEALKEVQQKMGAEALR